MRLETASPRLLLALAENAYHYFRTWRIDGTWERIHAVLREATLHGRQRAYPQSAAIIDSQTAKTTEKGDIRGFDGAKKISGRKRHLLVDSAGLVSAVVVHEGDIADREGAKLFSTKPPRSFPGWRRCGPTGATTARSASG